MPSDAVGPLFDCDEGDEGHRKDLAPSSPTSAYDESAPTTAVGPLFDCEAIGCERPADWAHVDQFGAIYLCEFHGGAINVEGWTRITRENRDAE